MRIDSLAKMRALRLPPMCAGIVAASSSETILSGITSKARTFMLAMRSIAINWSDRMYIVVGLNW